MGDFAVRDYPGRRQTDQGGNAMRVSCPKCGGSIEITVSFGPIRWGTNEFWKLEDLCHEWRDPVNTTAKASHLCAALEEAVMDAVAPDDPSAAP